VGVVTFAALGEPAHEVQVVGAIEAERVAVEDVDDEGQVAVGGELVGHQLAVLPDADDVGDVQDAGILVGLLWLGDGQVSVVLADLDVLAGGSTSARVSVMTRLSSPIYGFFACGVSKGGGVWVDRCLKLSTHPAVRAAGQSRERAESN
jgi:hypothetical protein